MAITPEELEVKKEWEGLASDHRKRAVAASKRGDSILARNEYALAEAAQDRADDYK